MLNRNKIIIALAMIMSASAFAGTEGGGGENSVVCFKDGKIPAAIRDPQSPRFGQILDSEIKNDVISIEAYDLYEARMPRGLKREFPTIISIPDHVEIRAYAEYIAQRFAPYVPSVTKIIQSGSDMLTDSRIIMRPTGLNRIHDENDVGYIDASRCVVATMAAQYNAGDETRVQLDGRLYGSPLHSRLSQAVTFLHESIYYSARNFAQHTDSRATRTLVSTLIGGASISSLELVNLLKRLHMPFSENMDNYFSALVRDVFEHASTDALSAEMRTQEVDHLAELYNAWIRRYGLDKEPPSQNRMANLFGQGEPSLLQPFAKKAGHYSDGYLTLETLNSDQILDICFRRAAGCKNNGMAIAQYYKGLGDRYLAGYQKFYNQLASEKIFPLIDGAPQFDGATKEKAKAIIAEGIKRWKMEILQYPRMYMAGPDKDFNIFKKLQELDFLIPAI